MRHHRPYAAALAAVVALGLGACTGDPEPNFADPTTDAPTSESVAPVTEPPTSEPTTEPEPESAQAFVRRWHQVSDAMQVSGDTTEYRRLGPDCGSCLDTADLVRGYYDAGGFIRFAGTKVVKIKRLGELGGATEFEVLRRSPPTRFRESSDASVVTLPGGQTSLRMRIKQVSGDWLVVDYSQIAS